MYEVAIIGAGPAGATAALFTAKAGKRTLLLDDGHSGQKTLVLPDGKSLTKRALIKNYYAIPEATQSEMFETGKQQVRTFGGEIVEAPVHALETLQGGVRILAGDRQFEAQHVVLATGSSVQLAESCGIHVRPGTEPRVEKVVAVDAQGRTNVPGVWAAGVAAGVGIHVIIAAGDGARVAINLISELNGERYMDHDIVGT